MSQEAVPYIQPKEKGDTGHACSHHLSGTGPVAAAIAVKKWLEKTGTQGTIKLYGTQPMKVVVAKSRWSEVDSSMM